MEQIAAYRANDGEIFSTAEECQEHEASLVWRQRISEFNASGMNPYPTGMHFNICKKVIIAWERFKASA